MNNNESYLAPETDVLELILEGMIASSEVEGETNQGLIGGWGGSY